MVTLTNEEFAALLGACHDALTALHYANTDPDTALRRNDPNIVAGIASLGPVYRELKKKVEKSDGQT